MSDSSKVEIKLVGVIVAATGVEYHRWLHFVDGAPWPSIRAPTSATHQQVLKYAIKLTSIVSDCNKATEAAAERHRCDADAENIRHEENMRAIDDKLRKQRSSIVSRSDEKEWDLYCKILKGTDQ